MFCHACQRGCSCAPEQHHLENVVPAAPSSSLMSICDRDDHIESSSHESKPVTNRGITPHTPS
jgi:hypothetical protein